MNLKFQISDLKCAAVLCAVVAIFTPGASAAATRDAGATVAAKQSNTKTNGSRLIGRPPLLPSASAAAPSPQTLNSQLSTLAVLPAPTNRPLVVNFTPETNQLYFTNEIGQTSYTDQIGNRSVDTFIRTVSRIPLPRPTNSLVVLRAGTNLIAQVITNRSPVVFSVSPTNRYEISLFTLLADGSSWARGTLPFPSAPSNVVTFLILPLFADRLETPEAQWQPGSNIFSLSVTNPGGASQFMRASVRVVKDDFTPKAVTFGNAYQLFPTNQP